MVSTPLPWRYAEERERAAGAAEIGSLLIYSFKFRQCLFSVPLKLTFSLVFQEPLEKRFHVVSPHALQVNHMLVVKI